MVNISQEIFDSKLTPNEFYILAILVLKKEYGFSKVKLKDLIDITSLDKEEIGTAIKSLIRTHNMIKWIGTDNDGNMKFRILTTSMKKKKKSITSNPDRPTVRDIDLYCTSKGYKIDAQKVFDYYNDNNWIDANGHEVLNWKQKIFAVWCKEENKISGSKFKPKPFDKPLT